ncbi:hypothetical protein ACTFIW_013306 [Dictyostelium discoideum]
MCTNETLYMISSNSGTLAYEALAQITQLGLGQSTHVILGNSTMVGSSFIDILQLFEQDLQTEGILLVGGMDGCEEALAASWIKKHATKPIPAYIAGRAPAFQKQYLDLDRSRDRKDPSSSAENFQLHKGLLVYAYEE